MRDQKPAFGVVVSGISLAGFIVPISKSGSGSFLRWRRRDPRETCMVFRQPRGWYAGPHESDGYRNYHNAGQLCESSPLLVNRIRRYRRGTDGRRRGASTCIAILEAVNEILADMRVVEASAFIAAPLGGLLLAQMGADVIRIDPVGGGLDYRRWPVTKDGLSLYWAGLNKGKRSIMLNVREAEGREIAQALMTRPGPNAGLVITNLPVRGWLDYEALRVKREDLVMVAVTGSRDGRVALDYTVNASAGFPFVTGPPDHEGPINHVMPVWDVVAGCSVVQALLAAERFRRDTGEGQLARLALADTAFATLSHLGYVAEAEVNGVDRPRTANDVYGSYGRDFETADGRRVMVTAMTVRHWQALLEATGTAGGDTRARTQARGRLAQRRTALRRTPCDWRDSRTLVQRAQPRRGAYSARCGGRMLGTVPDVHASPRRRSGGFDRESAVRGDRAAGNRLSPSGRGRHRLRRFAARTRAARTRPRTTHGRGPFGRARSVSDEDWRASRRGDRRRTGWLAATGFGGAPLHRTRSE